MPSAKRQNVISWDEFFMRVAIAAQLRSKDPNTQVGACIASTNHRILSVGYNGTPSALNDDDFPWGTSDDPLEDYLDNKYADTDDGRISRRILDSCGITYRQVLVDA